jgi:hypothetical protein
LCSVADLFVLNISDCSKTGLGVWR